MTKDLKDDLRRFSPILSCSFVSLLLSSFAPLMAPPHPPPLRSANEQGNYGWPGQKGEGEAEVEKTK